MTQASKIPLFTETSSLVHALRDIYSDYVADTTSKHIVVSNNTANKPGSNNGSC